MIKSKSSSCFKKLSNRWFCVIGGFILLLSFSADFSYPNINTYLTSYMRNNATNGYNNDLTYDDWVFLTTTKVVVQGGSMPFIGVLNSLCQIGLSVFICFKTFTKYERMLHCDLTTFYNSTQMKVLGPRLGNCRKPDLNMESV